MKKNYFVEVLKKTKKTKFKSNKFVAKIGLIMLKVGIIGVGFWGETCIKYILRMNHVAIVGFVDTDAIKAKNMSSIYHIDHYNHVEQLIDECDAMIITIPSIFHYDIATKVIRKGKHFFIEYPIGKNIEEGNLLIQLIKEANVKCQIGFLEIFNPAYKQVEKYFEDLTFVEIKHLLPINNSNLKLNMLLEVLPQDIYLLLHTIKTPLKNISANSMNILTDNCDLFNIHLEFQNGCTAHITTSRITQNEDEIYTMDLMQSNAHIKINFLEQQSDILFFNKIEDTSLSQKRGKIQVGIEHKLTFQSFSMNKIYEELESFFSAIINAQSTCINEFDGVNVLEICEEIKKQIIQKNQSIKL